MKNQIPPHETEIELSALASMFLHPDDRARALDLLSPDDFYASAHRVIFKKCAELSSNGNRLDAGFIWAALSEDEQEKIGGAHKLAAVLDAPPAVDIEKSAAILKDRNARRRTLERINSIQKRVMRKNSDLSKVQADADAIIQEINQAQADSAQNGGDRISLNEIITQKVEENPIINNFLYKDDQAVIYAPGGVGKSLVAQDMAMSLAAQSDSLYGTFNIPQSACSLFVQSENSNRAIYQRTAKKCKGNHSFIRGLENVFYSSSFNSPQIAGHASDAAFRSKIINLSKSIEDEINSKIVVIFFDPLISFHDADESDNSRMRTTLDYISEIGNQIDATPVVIHHANKEGGLRGATAIWDWARNVIKLSDASYRGQKRIKFKHEKCNNAEMFEPFILAMDEHLNFSPVEFSDTMPKGVKQRCEKVKEALHLLGDSADSKSMLINQYRELAGLEKTATIHRHINEAVEHDFIQMEYYREGDLKKARYWIDVKPCHF